MITHSHAYLWLDSGILNDRLDHDGNHKVLKSYLKEIRAYCIKRAGKELGINRREAESSDEFKNYYGMMGEVLVEFWMRKFGHFFDISNIADTSSDKYFRGHDFLGSSITSKLPIRIQVKMRKDAMKTFTMYELETFFEEAEKLDIMPQCLFLVVPTSALPKQEILHWQDNFKRDYADKMRYIGFDEMARQISNLRNINGDVGGHGIFFVEFFEALQNSQNL